MKREHYERIPWTPCVHPRCYDYVLLAIPSAVFSDHGTSLPDCTCNGNIKKEMTHAKKCNDLIEQWIKSAPDEIKPLWRRVSTTLWVKNGVDMCTLQWDYYHLDLATFAVPSNGEVNVISDQNMVWNKDNKTPTLVHKSKNPDGDLATVCDMVDEFLSGNWTPHWTCYKCRERKRGRIKPH